MSTHPGKRTANVKVTLNKRNLDALEPADKPWIAWDDRLTGFGVRVQPSGVKSFIVNYRAGGGGRRAPNKRVVVGRYGRVTPERARRLAQELLGRVAAGEDPAGERARARVMPTLGEAFEDYMAADPNRKESTNRHYRSEVRLYLGDWLARPLDAITRRDVEARFNRVTREVGWSPANQIVSLLRSIYRRNCVDTEGLHNPVDQWLAGGGRCHRPVRRRIPTPAEVLPRWRKGIETAVRNPATRDALWFGLYTGIAPRGGPDPALGAHRHRGAHIPGRGDQDRRAAGVAADPATGRRYRVPPYGGRGNAGARPALGVRLRNQRLGPHLQSAASLRADRARRRRQVLVSRHAQLLHYGGRARPGAAPVADQAAGQPRPAPAT